MSESPKLILLFFGKRKSGKDYVTDFLHSRLNSQLNCDISVIVRLSGPLKRLYAQNHGLDFAQLLSSSSYKEKYRLPMIQWSEELRNRDPGYFCRAAIKDSAQSANSVWIVSDCRRSTDLAFFEREYPGKTLKVKVTANEETRMKRGFRFMEGVDDKQSECGLDHVTEKDIHFIIHNDDDNQQGFKTEMEELERKIKDLI